TGTYKDLDCRGLYLINEEGGRRFWQFRFTVNSRDARVEWPVSEIGLADARDRATKWRDMPRQGVDPRRAGLKADEHKVTFKAFADAKYPDFCVGMNERESERWVRAISQVPSLHSIPVLQITSL